MKSNPVCEGKFGELLRLVQRLRGPDGCPWDRAQGKADIGRYLLEEAYEVIEALEGTPEHLREELGDLLFHILFLSHMAEEAGEFTTEEVLSEIQAKMVRRHPHVFGNAGAVSESDVRVRWEQIKREVEHRGQDEPRLISGLPRSLPTLARAQRTTARAAEAGFDWPDVEGVLRKVEEELSEFRAALKSDRPERIRDEAGDLIFTLVNLCRFVRVDAEEALRSSLRKFVLRFSRIESELARRGRTPGESTQAEMDLIWEEAKRPRQDP